jgi:4-carboxymuconolactone decarboxylase
MKEGFMPRGISWTVISVVLLVLTGSPRAQEPSQSATHPGANANSPAQSVTGPSQTTLPKDIDPGSRARLPNVKREDLDEDGKKTYDLIVNQTTPYSRGLPTPIGMWMHSPKMAQYILPAYMYLRFGTRFGTRLTELAILVTAREINSQFQWTSHEPTALKIGLGQDVIDVVKYRRSLAGLGEKEAVIIAFGRELFSRKVTSETFAHALKLFGREGVTDLAGLMAFYQFLYYSSNVAFDIQMPPDWHPLLPTLPSSSSPSGSASLPASGIALP